MEALIGVVVGAALVLVASKLFSGIRDGLRPLAKEVIKGGLVVSTAVDELVAEAKAELAQAKEESGADAGTKA